MLSLSLFFAQGVTLHVHTLDHGHDGHWHGHLAGVTGDHAHFSKAHFSHIGDHDHIVSEVDISPNGMLTKLVSSHVLILAFIAFILLLSPTAVSRRLVHCYSEGRLALYRCYLLSPPLRAPPLLKLISSQYSN